MFFSSFSYDIDDNECNGDNDCHNMATCTNTYECACNPGYSGNGKTTCAGKEINKLHASHRES